MHSHGKLSSIRNIIFDMDGTIADTAKVSVPSCQRTAKLMGLPVKSGEEIAGMIGWASPEFYYRLYPEVDRGFLAEYAKAVEINEKIIMRELGEDLLFQGIKDVLHFLSERGYFLCVASTGDTDHVNSSLTSSGVISLFDIIKCDESEKVDMVKSIIDSGPDGNWAILDRICSGRFL
jgi:phosphoglycolate phosphatase-like HAD superfamily hydrolase